MIFWFLVSPYCCVIFYVDADSFSISTMTISIILKTNDRSNHYPWKVDDPSIIVLAIIARGDRNNSFILDNHSHLSIPIRIGSEWCAVMCFMIIKSIKYYGSYLAGTIHDYETPSLWFHHLPWTDYHIEAHFERPHFVIFIQTLGTWYLNCFP